MSKFIFTDAYLSAALALPEELRGRALEAVARYGLFGETTTDAELIPFMAAIKPTIDAGHELSRVRAEAGRAGGIASGSKRSKTKQNEANEANASKTKQTKQNEAKFSTPIYIDNTLLEELRGKPYIDIYIDKEKEKEIFPTGIKKKKEKPPFSRPSRDDVAAYIREKGLDVDPDRFCDHYDANGWKVGGKSAMKDWRAAVRNWARMDAERKRTPVNKFHNFDARKTDYDTFLGMGAG